MMRSGIDARSSPVGPTAALKPPHSREWEQWTRGATYGGRETGFGQLREWIEVTEVAVERVTFEAYSVLPTGEDRVYTSGLHFRDAYTLETALHDAGFGHIEVDGGWHGDDATATSRLLVFRAGGS